ncbi:MULTISPECIES: hypothetical protein [Thermoactinomyces]|jgi:quercetin dioxygenase-like cupin family protein|uniref:AraC-type arabinose-binding/dimerisation domain-containing protein n=1 Tax=Thermoactinomyces daqus TaxID=1329516 RepID=A0A7W1XAP9_9BACL|nr:MULTISPECIES: hypothetical protein [Thermoactinomyces]MBA4543228.1 hypothetical protein [Thermoactinomyces daqus]MBH8597727.1 hypothetical protein [Thermoactinomyces sp. CICC 10523]MBH8604069.1 hypothetical protein [Thermoactinomyces sp. CICC 10522]MBH8606397.1 hypothetical protein [Thermoactinomyces sp. CICC 10521]
MQMVRIEENHSGKMKVLDFNKGEVINIRLKSGETIPRHYLNSDAIIFLIRGEIMFSVYNQRFRLKPCSLLQLSQYEIYEMEAIFDTSLLVFKI